MFEYKEVNDVVLREIASAAGISRIADVTSLDRISIPVVMVIRPSSRGFVVSQGKGLDMASAERSGIMESLEGYFAESVRSALLYRSTDEFVGTQRCVDVEQLPRARGRRLRPGERLLWIAGIDLITNREVWVPFECVHADYTVPSGIMPGHFLVSSNGLAVAHEKTVAVLHALCEVIERDALSIFVARNGWLNPRSKINLDSISSSHVATMIERVRSVGIEVHAWDVSSDIGIPVIWATLLDKRASNRELVHKSSGLGCHPEASHALVRAILEAVQSRATVISGSRDDLRYADYDSFPCSAIGVEELFMMEPLAALPVGFPAGLDANGYLSVIGERLSRLGFSDIAVVSLNEYEQRVAAVRVIVPGLEGPHLHPDYFPGSRAARVGQ
jgi:YcaO-like protein with predicted kinase domain